MSFNGPNAVDTENVQAVETQWAIDAINDLGSRPLAHHEMEAISRIMGDVGSEAHLALIGEMASTSSGKLGLNRTLAADVDEAVEARVGQTRSYNISAAARIEEEDPLGPASVEVTQAYIDLESAGVPAEELNNTLNESDVYNPMGVMKAMADLAVFYGVTSANWTIEGVAIDNQVEQVNDMYAQQQATAQATLNVEPNPYNLAGTDPNMTGPASPTRT